MKLTDRQLRERFNVSRQTTASWRKEGEIKFFRLPNGRIRYDMERHVLPFERKRERNV